MDFKDIWALLCCWRMIRCDHNRDSKSSLAQNSPFVFLFCFVFFFPVHPSLPVAVRPFCPVLPSLCSSSSRFHIIIVHLHFSLFFFSLALHISFFFFFLAYYRIAQLWNFHFDSTGKLDAQSLKQTAICSVSVKSRKRCHRTWIIHVCSGSGHVY